MSIADANTINAIVHRLLFVRTYISTQIYYSRPSPATSASLMISDPMVTLKPQWLPLFTLTLQAIAL